MARVRVASSADTAGTGGTAEPGVYRGHVRVISSGWVWVGCFAAMLGVLLARSRFLFTTRLAERGDAASNSILMAQAEHFTLLHGNYSRMQFFHPGPGYLYLQAFGQWLFHDLTHLVPTPWNGQLIVVLLLNSALVATVVWIIRSWAGSVWPAAAAFAVMVGFAAVHGQILASPWMPYLYVPTYFTFIVAGASVAAGRTAHMWVLAATGWLLIHGHAEFLILVPVTIAAVAAMALWPRRRAPWRALSALASRRMRHWLPAVAISALFALPIALDLVLHWPGEFGKYLTYTQSARAGHHPPTQVIAYVLWFWWPGREGAAAAAAAVATAVTLMVAVTAAPPLRRFLLAGLAMNVVATALIIYYASRGVDHMNAKYVGYFYWSVPLFTLVLAAAGAVARAARAPAAWAAARLATAGAVAAAVTAALLAPSLRADVHDDEPDLAAAVSTLAARSPGRLIVLRVSDSATLDAQGLVLQAERTGVRTCVTGPTFWIFAATSQFRCSRAELAGGVAYQMHGLPYRPARTDGAVVLRLGLAVITAVK